MCFTWLRTNGGVDTDVCNLVASLLNDMVVDSNAYPMFGAGFSCSNVNAANRTVRACGDFTSEAAGNAFGGMLSSTGFDALALALSFGNIYVAGPGGSAVCDPSSFQVELFTKLTGVSCNAWSYSSACAPPVENLFPYCKCESGVPRKTPYTLKYKSKTSKGKDNYFCFEVKVNQSACGTGKCCSMDLDKVEFLADETKCRWAATGFTVSTKPNDVKSPVWARQNDVTFNPPKAFDVFKFNNLGITVANGNGATICIALKKEGTCPGLEDFCHQGDIGCEYAIFDKAAGCCTEDWSLATEGTFDRRRFRSAL